MINTNQRLRRSVLYTPGSNARAMEKAKRLGADTVIYDLEDAVFPSEKCKAREYVVAALSADAEREHEVIVRVNGLNTPWYEGDLRAIAGADIDGILFPKIDSASEVLDALKALDVASLDVHMPLWIMAETPACILRIDAIAGAHQRLAGVVVGTSDLAVDMRARHTRDRAALLTALSMCVMAARAHGLAIIDGVHLDLEDFDGFADACSQGRDLGFDGKSLIHPKQVEVANRFFAPTESEIAGAQRIVDAWDKTQQERKGVVVVDGRLVERLHVDEAIRTLQKAELTKRRVNTS